MLWFALTVWIGGFDLIYACQDVEFDRANGLHSIPGAVRHRGGAARGQGLPRASPIVAFATLGWMVGLGAAYWVGVLVVTGLFVYEHSLVSPIDLSRLDIAFFNVNGYIAVILFLAVLAGRFA